MYLSTENYVKKWKGCALNWQLAILAVAGVGMPGNYITLIAYGDKALITLVLITNILFSYPSTPKREKPKPVVNG